VKKFAVILLLFVYATTTVGATVHIHYCMGKFVGWEFTQHENSKCGKCGMTESKTKKGCCKDETKQFKIDTDHQKASVDCNLNSIVSPALLSAFQINTIEYFPLQVLKENITRPPPNIAKQDLVVLYGNFRI
jgi:hypothetical protein